jgi:hypothetical protein
VSALGGAAPTDPVMGSVDKFNSEGGSLVPGRDVATLVGNPDEVATGLGAGVGGGVTTKLGKTPVTAIVTPTLEKRTTETTPATVTIPQAPRLLTQPQHFAYVFLKNAPIF